MHTVDSLADLTSEWAQEERRICWERGRRNISAHSVGLLADAAPATVSLYHESGGTPSLASWLLSSGFSPTAISDVEAAINAANKTTTAHKRSNEPCSPSLPQHLRNLIPERHHPPPLPSRDFKQSAVTSTAATTPTSLLDAIGSKHRGHRPWRNRLHSKTPSSVTSSEGSACSRACLGGCLSTTAHTASAHAWPPKDGGGHGQKPVPYQELIAQKRRKERGNAPSVCPARSTSPAHQHVAHHLPTSHHGTACLSSLRETLHPSPRSQHRPSTIPTSAQARAIFGGVALGNR